VSFTRTSTVEVAGQVFLEDLIRAKYHGASADEIWGQFLERSHQANDAFLTSMVPEMVTDFFELHRFERRYFVFDRP
jgi:hypothetical protein